jgi:hypothetical protein
LFTTAGEIMIRSLAGLFLTAATVAMFSATAFANEAGQIKTAKGAVHIERDGQKLPATIGTKVLQSDTVVTGADGSVGITFTDNSLLSAGPNSTLAIERYAFDPTTHAGAFDTRLSRGTLAGVSGKIAKQTPGAMTVKTPAAILGVRSTEFVVRAEDGTL